jgi:hypothetical protein
LEQYAADVFAAHLLMPHQAVISAFQRRKLRLERPLPAQVLLVAGESAIIPVRGTCEILAQVDPCFLLAGDDSFAIKF